ncbi:MAG: DUF664 domain-containing protein [Planctomycetota bacterium]|nr:MAG: DUF664 domain-containing protein [Planctomycetota bacterium]
MPLTNPAEILLAHDTWATEHILDACAGLGHEQFHQQFDMGLGSLHDTLAHILGAVRGWTDMLTGREPRARIEQAGPYTLEQLRVLLAEVTAEFNAALAAHPLDDFATAERGGKSYSFPRGGVLTHVTTHGMHHRAQCLNMLRHLGVAEQPPSSVMQWMLTAND